MGRETRVSVTWMLCGGGGGGACYPWREGASWRHLSHSERLEQP